jgi:hypothetical protein
MAGKAWASGAGGREWTAMGASAAGPGQRRVEKDSVVECFAALGELVNGRGASSSSLARP